MINIAKIIYLIYFLVPVVVVRHLCIVTTRVEVMKMTFIYMWCCCIFTPLHCEDYSKDYEDDDSNSMIFLF